MQFNVEHRAFARALQTVKRAVAQRSTLPILSAVQIECGPDAIKLTATDNEMSAEVQVPAEIVEAGDPVAVNAGQLSELVSALSGEIVSVKSGEQTTVHVTCGGSNYQLLGLPSEEFPPLAQVAEDGLRFVVTASEMRAGLRCILAAVSEDDTRPVLCGALLEVTAERVRMLSTDTHKAAIRTLAVTEWNGMQKAVILPRRILKELVQVIPDEPAELPVLIVADQNQAAFAIGEVRLTTRLIEGKFAQVDRVFPKGHTVTVTLPADRLREALKRVMFIAKENLHRVSVMTEGEVFIMTAQAGTAGRANENLAATVEGEGHAVWQADIHGEQFGAILAAIPSGEVVIETSPGMDGTSPTPYVIRSKDDPAAAWLHIPLMPSAMLPEPPPKKRGRSDE